MSVFRVHKTKDFTVLSNYHLKDKGLSLQAKGLLSVMLSLPDDWKYSISGLAAISKEGKKAIKSTLDELKEHGYLVVTKHAPKAGDRYISYEYDVFERPVSTKPQVGQAYPSVGLLGEPLLDGTLLNTQEHMTNNKKDSMSEKKSDAFESDIKAIIDYFNERCDTRYTYRNKAVNGMIRARLSEGFTVEDFRTVINTKAAKWENDPKMRDYLRPKTLFSATNFESYLNESPQPSSYLDSVNWSAYELEQIDPSTIN